MLPTKATVTIFLLTPVHNTHSLRASPFQFINMYQTIYEVVTVWISQLSITISSHFLYHINLTNSADRQLARLSTNGFRPTTVV